MDWIGEALRDAQRMGTVSACIGCAENTEPPYMTEDLNKGWRAWYRCSDCGMRWQVTYRD